MIRPSTPAGRDDHVAASCAQPVPNLPLIETFGLATQKQVGAAMRAPFVGTWARGR